MGGESSKESRDGGGTYSREAFWGGGSHYEYGAPPAPSTRGGHYEGASQPYYAPPPPDYDQPYEPHRQPPPAAPKRALDRRYSRISDNYSTLEQVTEDLARSGLESSNLIVGVDFTKSNEWTGKYSFRGHSLHQISDVPNPYEQAISIIGRTLSAFDEDNLIPCFGFGDASTHDQDVFSFYPDGRSCYGFPEALERYRELVPHLRLAGPTSFAPIIETAMTIVEQSGGQYHVLVIIADGQVTRSVDTQHGQFSSQERKTVEAIVKASKLPLSIILVGVGDGPWDMMKEFDDNIPARSFDNFQFVNFTEIMSKNLPQAQKEAAFALAALMEIPAQYKATLELGILGHHSGESLGRAPLPPPVQGYNSYNNSKNFKSTSVQQNSPSFSCYHSAPTAPSALSSSNDNQLCPICLTNPKDMAFGCGHQTCCDCGSNLQSCPICRSTIQTRIKLY